MTSSSHNIGPFGPRSINPRTKIAVIGAGIAGHGAAWALSKQCNVTLFERETQFGGHSYTYDVKCDGYTVPVDMGFIVYNELNYPNLVGLFNTLGVKTERSNMSFSVSLNNGAYEYHGSGLKGVFAQKRNLLHPGHLRMLLQVLKFYKSAPVEARARDLTQITLGEWLSELGMGRGFRERHIVPMAACIWSASAQEILDFPAAAFVRFFENHGLFKLKQRPLWRTVSGGSRSYVKALHDDMQAVTRRACPVSAVERGADSVTVHSPNGAEMFDEVIIATHGDEALPLIENPTRAETETLSAFRYSSNEVILHTDHRLMPKRRKVWSSWNYVAPSVIDPGRPVPLTYWMNRLQNLPANQDIFVTLNPLEPIAPKYVQQRRTFMHPIFDARTYAAQPKLQDLQGADRIWFAGSYFGYGFHEDALSSGLAVAKALGARLPWEEGAQAVAAE